MCEKAVTGYQLLRIGGRTYDGCSQTTKLSETWDEKTGQWARHILWKFGFLQCALVFFSLGTLSCFCLKQTLA